MVKEKADFEISQPKLELVTLYANNEIYRQVLQISLSDHDWCELQTQPCYQELLNYLDNLETQRNIGNHIEKRFLKAKIVEVIKTESVEGTGTKEDPVRTVVRYWDKDGNLIAESEK